MGSDVEERHSSKHKHHHSERDTKRNSKKRRKERDGDEREDKRKRKHRDKSEKSSSCKKDDHEDVQVVDDDVDDDDMWVEKNIDMEGEKLLATDIPTAESLKLTSRSTSLPDDPLLPKPVVSETSLRREEWMLPPESSIITTTASERRQPALAVGDDSLTDGYGEPSQGIRNLGDGVDFFSGLGTEVKRQNKSNRVDLDKPKISSRELNVDLREGRQIDWNAPEPKTRAVTPGGPGSQWRMMRLRRVYETAEEEGKSIEEVAVDRFGSLETFEAAKEERRILDERDGRRGGAERERGRGGDRKGKDRESGSTGNGEKGFMFSDIGGSSASSRSSSFRRPGGPAEATPSTPSPASRPSNRRLDSLRLPSQAASPLSQSHTPVPSVLNPQASRRRALSPSSLNKLQAKALRAKLMGSPDAEQLEREYEEAKNAADGAVVEDGVRTKVELLPTLDAQGRLYDVGLGREDGALPQGNRKKKEKVETRDPKTGELIRVNADDDEITLGEMLRQERFGAGAADQKSLDAEFAKAVMTDVGFQNDLDYMDDNAERLGRKKMRSDAIKRQFAIHDYKRTQKALETCPFCFGEDDSPPKAPVTAMGTRVYLSCTLHDELVPGHCLIVPIQHHLAMLEGDDDVWDEVRNFMKCLMRMFAEDDKGVVFYETVISFKWQKHTFIECVPLPWEQYEEIPQYFKESILASEAEWSQHKKLIDFSARPGGFRRAMVPNLPYFMVQFDHKGERGYGHVIEGTGESAAAGEEDALEEGEKGGGEFPRYFAGEIIGNVLDAEPRRWRRPRRIDFSRNRERVKDFMKKYDQFDWTKMIERS